MCELLNTELLGTPTRFKIIGSLVQDYAGVMLGNFHALACENEASFVSEVF